MSKEYSPEFKSARSAALNETPRFEVFEHKGSHYAVRQSNGKISRALQDVGENAFDRIVETVILTVHEAIPVRAPGGEQATENYQVPKFEAVLGKDNLPQLEAIHDPTGKPVVIDGKVSMRPVMRLVVDENGAPVTETRSRPAFTMGERLFNSSDRAQLLEQSTADDSFIGKALAAFARVNDQEAAKVLAKKG